MFKQYKLKNYHFHLIIYICALTLIGIFVIGSARPDLQPKQIFGFVVGICIMLAVSLMDYSFLLKFPWLYYALMIGLLLMVEFFGKNVNGAQRWLEIGGEDSGITIQPSEFAKLAIVAFFAYFFAKTQENISTLKNLIISFVFAGIPLILILKQPDLSTTIVTAVIFVALLFISGLSYKIVMTVLAVAVPTVIVVLTYCIQLAKSTDADYPYQLDRIMAWLYPTDPRWVSKALQQQNSIMAIGSGQLWGKGLNNSEATSMLNTNYILEPQTDFIFAVIGEELGFVGCAAVVALLFFTVVECIYIGSRAKDLQGRLICCGMATWIGFQSFVNIGVNTGLLPNTGVPLPFVSYGLSSVIAIYIGMGFVLNVGLQPKKY
ncbi:MAG: rod shape-determining protein RodA [Agathobacter sp.]|nr:rod shape-determining protein RodA [Agathobacter sp.]